MHIRTEFFIIKGKFNHVALSSIFKVYSMHIFWRALFHGGVKTGEVSTVHFWRACTFEARTLKFFVIIFKRMKLMICKEPIKSFCLSFKYRFLASK